MKRPLQFRHVGLTLFGLVVVLWAASCSKGPTVPPRHQNQAPHTELTYAPVQYDTTTFRVHFYWNGFDDDGEVTRFHFAVDDDTLRLPSQWRTTTAKDTTLLFLVDPVKELKIHVFKVAAEDNLHAIDPHPASRAFSAKTLPPNSKIERGPAAFNPIVGTNFTYEWSGLDPDGGETGGKVPVDSFQYQLLRIGATSGDPLTFSPLPPFDQTRYTGLVRDAVGDGLLDYGAGQKYDDWKWLGIRSLRHRFRNVTPGEYVFAERAVDVASATEKDLLFVRNIRHFTVTNRNAGPLLVVCSSILNRCLDGATGPTDYARKPLQIFEGETVSFSWSASADTYGGEIVGYTFALDDTSVFQGLDVRLTGATFQPNQLPPGNHFLYVRTVDDGGLTTNMVVPILVVHPAFKDPGAAHTILFVDDSILLFSNGSAPNDATETDWWTLGPGGVGPLFSLGVSYTEWDTNEQSLGSFEGRKQPEARDLAPFTTVVWTADNQNGGSTQTALFKTVAGGDYSELQGYLRAGGTLILTGWNIAQNTTGKNANLTYDDSTPGGICAAFAPGSPEYSATIFPRMFMGIDNSRSNVVARRLLGASDFVRAIPTPTGVSFGFDTARVDTGNIATGGAYKWNTNSNPLPNTPDEQLFPGLPGIEGWIMATNFGCIAHQNFGIEGGATPIAQVVYRYHGVREGAAQNGSPSPREGLAVGALIKSHDLGNNGGHYVPSAAIGRIALFTFPFYFLHDAEAINIMKKAFDYVNASPTLP